jgi:membrane protein
MINYNLIKNVIKKYLRKLWQLIWGTFISYNKHSCPNMAAGMSFYGLMSLVPLVIVAVSTLGYIIGSSENAQKFVSTVLYEQFPVSANEILDQIETIIMSPESSIISVLSLIGLMWSGMKFFNILQSVLNSIWVGASQRRFLWGNITVLLIFIAAGLLFWLSFAFDWLLKGIGQLNLQIVSDLSVLSLIVKFIIPFISLMTMTFLSYLFITNAKISTISALIGSFFTTVFLELYKWAFSTIIVNFSNYGTVYGSLAGIIIFMSWLYMSMSILLVGAELGSQCQQMFFNDVVKQK